jgi:hypothetical protein
MSNISKAVVAQGTYPNRTFVIQDYRDWPWKKLKATAERISQKTVISRTQACLILYAHILAYAGPEDDLTSFI